MQSDDNLKEEYFFLFQSTKSGAAEMIMRENPDLTAFLTLDLKIWIDTKYLRGQLAPVDEGAKELFVVIARVLVGKHNTVGSKINNDLPFYTLDN